jgi:hypothetical protein
VPRVLLPKDCAGFSDDGVRFMGERGPGSFINLDDDRQLAKLRNQEYSSAGLSDCGPEKYFPVRAGDGRWCGDCRRTWWRWSLTCPRCGRDTVPEGEVAGLRARGLRPPLGGPLEIQAGEARALLILRPVPDHQAQVRRVVLAVLRGDLEGSLDD